MKSVIRIFNFIIIGISALAIALLFLLSTFSFNSSIGLKAEFFNSFNEMIPASLNVDTIDVPHVLGTDTVYVSLKFDLNFNEVNRLMGTKDKDLINQELVENNIQTTFVEMHEPVEILTEYTVRTVLRKIAKEELTKQIQNALTGAGTASTAEDVMNEMGMDDNYFRGFAKLLYDTAKPEADPTNPDKGVEIDVFTNVIFDKIKELLIEAKEVTGGSVDENALTEERKTEIKNVFISKFNDVGLIMEDGTHLYLINKISYLFLAKMIKQTLSSVVSDPTVLERKSNENLEAYAERLTTLYVESILPEVFYTIVSYVCLGLFIGILVFAVIWAILILISLIRTFSKEKPWTIFGPWFWIFGSLQVVLGLALTIFCKFYLPGLSFVQNALAGSPITSIGLAPRTATLIPSMIFLGMIVVAIVYTILAHPVKKEYKDKKYNRGPKPKEIIINE